MRFPIRYKLAAIILVILVPMIIFSGFHYLAMLRESKAHYIDHNLSVAFNTAEDLDELIRKTKGILHSLSMHPAVKALNSSECDRLFGQVLPSYPEYFNILLADMDGYNRGSGVQSPVLRRLNYRDKAWFQNGRKGSPAVGDIHISKLFDTPTVMITVPVFGKGRVQTGVLAAPLKISKIRESYMGSWQLPERSTITVIDSGGTVIFDTLGSKMTGRNLNTPFTIRALGRDSGSEELTGADGIRRLYSFSSMSEAGWKVMVGVPVEEAYRYAYRMSRNYLTMLLFVCGLALVLSTILSRRISANIASLISGMKEIERGNLSFKLHLPGHDELGEVAKSLNKMAVERGIAEQKVRDSESFLSSILEGIGEGVIVVDREFRIISVNEGYCAYVKASCEDIVGEHCYEVSHHSDMPCYENETGCECTVKQCFETGEHHRSVHTHYDSEGNAVYIETNAYPLKDSSGAIVYAIETLRDVTDRVVLEKRLEEVKEQYKKLYDYAPDMMHSVDSRGIIVVCNLTMAKTLGYAPEELVGQPFEKVFDPALRSACMKKFEHLAAAGFCEEETTLLSKDGRKIPVFLRSRATYDREGNFIMADMVSRDVSEKKSLHAQLLQAQKLEAIGTLTGGIAHDFNNILTAIIGYGNLLSLKMKEDDALRSYVEQVLSAAGRAANLTQSLLAFSRKQIIDPRPVDLNEVIRSVEKLLSRLIGEDIDFIMRLSSGNLTVLADRGQIEQALINLVTNARDAMPEGGTLVMSTEPAMLTDGFAKAHGFGKPGMYALITVTDTGTGIDRNSIERIFEPFYTTKETGKGTGLGLSIVHGIVKQHDGYITVYSEPGEGTTFKVYLPFTGSEDEEAKSSEAIPLRGGAETILVTEDDALVRTFTKNILEEFGYSVIEASDGEESVSIFSGNREKIDLVILDVIMPKKNGKEVHEELKKIDPDVKVLFMSGYSEDIIHRKGILEKGTHFVSKPVSPHELLNKVRELLD